MVQRVREARIRVGEGAASWTARADVRPLFARLTGAGGSGCEVAGESRVVELTPAEARIALADSTGAVRGELLVTEIAVSEEGTRSSDDRPAPLRLDRLHGLAVIRE